MIEVERLSTILLFRERNSYAIESQLIKLLEELSVQLLTCSDMVCRIGFPIP